MLIIVVAIMQQTGSSVAAKAAGQPPGAPGGPMVAPAPLNLEISARIAAKVHAVWPDPRLTKSLLPGLEDAADSPEQEIRVAIVAAELGEREKARSLLDKAHQDRPDDAELARDTGDLDALYGSADGLPAELAPEAADRLVERFGWYGRLATAYGKPETDPERAAVVGGGAALLAVLLTIMAVVGAAFLTGLVLLTVAIVKVVSGRFRWRFVPPARGGSVAIETVAVFVAGFILLKSTTEVVAAIAEGAPGAGAGNTGAAESVALLFTLTVQWLLAAVIFWPAVQGVPRREGLALLGLHRGRGVLREIGCGVIGYLACLPIMAVGVVVTVILLVLQAVVQHWLTNQKPPPIENPIAELVGGGGNSWLIVMLFALASLWAPLVEETIFRGALYRHLRARWRVGGAALVTALAFGLMHGYPLLALGPVISIGLGFALLREWRGSIIASMTGHCIHNASVLTMLLVVTRLLGM